MAKTILQSVEFDASPEELFDIFLDPKQHAAVIGSKVSVSAKEGDEFIAFDGHVKGRNLLIVPKRMIVQCWHGSVWNEGDLDSIQIMTFEKTSRGAQIILVHANCPDQFTERWNELYWEPLRAYLKRKPEKRSGSSSS